MSIKDKFALMNIPEDVIKEVWEVITDGHGLVNTLSEYNPYVKFINNRINKRIEKKCERFLEGLAMKVFSSDQLSSSDLEKLEGLLKKNRNRELVFDILEEATKTASNTSSKILGIIAGEVLQGYRTYDYHDWILVDGLKKMNDWDIESFKKIYSHFEAYPQKTRVNTTRLLQIISIEEYEQLMKNPSQAEEYWLEEEKKIMKSEEYKTLRSSLMRINSFQILTLGPVTFDTDSVNFERSQAGDELYKLIKVIG
ncbi:hypothetical protein [Bacillus toyonensis]|uniref:hypothetical protein n=1 Tax=Bacillus toyonensis TaxID=155322 RepID=UPI0009B1AC5D|nr:hypothetical protein [Bacillus toyonensis]OQD34186.1 hypothetical protein B1K97_01508 [Bacillus toyonensis]